ncbi:MAG: elongation factor G [Egibacteraceae bacterium]
MNGRATTPTDRIRTVALVGQGGTGKTALAEALLRVAGVGNPRGGTFDFEPEERERGRSLATSVARLAWRDHAIYLLDTPGAPDAVGDAYPALQAADLAVFVVDATAGTGPQHDQLWEACDTLGLPRVVFLNQLDRAQAAFQTNVDALRARYGKPLAPVHMPIGVGERFNGVIDLLHFIAVTRVDGGRAEVDVPAERREQAERNREFLVEAIVENDDELLMRYLDGQVPEPKDLGAVFARGIADGGFFPLLCGSVAADVGVRLLADFLIEECPSPLQRPAWQGIDGERRTADGPPTLLVAKTLSDPYVGRINVLRVCAGTLRPDATMTVNRTGESVRLHALFSLRGPEQTAVTEAVAGSLVGVAKLQDVRTGDTLHAKGEDFALPTLSLPMPQHRVGLEPASAGDEDKLSTALRRVAEEDPALRVERNTETRQLVLHAYGPTHVDVTLARLQRKFGVSVVESPLRIAYRETLRGRASATGRHVKQSGGHGQYAVATLAVAPLPRGEGFIYDSKIVGGAVPHQFIPSVEKGVVDAMAKGVLAGYPVVDVAATLTDGKFHSVDSSDMAFQIAGALAFRTAAEDAGLVLLEPVLDVAVTVPDALTGDVMGDLSARRGRIHGTEQTRPGLTTVHAHVPEAELLTYVAEFRSLSSGAGDATLTYDHHEEVPEHVARTVIAHAAE